jgi:hypothetical protein
MDHVIAQTTAPLRPPAPQVAAARAPLGFAVDEDARPGQQAALAGNGRAIPVYYPMSDGEVGRTELSQAVKEPTVELGFGDFLDLINPLQHIPVVSTFYREATGDAISAPARILGGFLFGGPLGFIASIINAISEEITGKDIGETAVAALLGDDDGPATAVAARSGAETAAETGDAAPEVWVGASAKAASAPEPPAALIRSVSPEGAADPVANPMISASAGTAVDTGQPSPLSGQPALDAFLEDLRGAGLRPGPDQGRNSPATGPLADAAQARGSPASDGPPPSPREISAIPRAKESWPPLPASDGLPPAPLPNAAATPASTGAGAPTAGSEAEPVATIAPVMSSSAAGPRAAFANQMLRALDKYQALSLTEAEPGRVNGRQVDQNL